MFPSVYMTTSYFTGGYFVVLGADTSGDVVPSALGAGWLRVGIVRRDAEASGEVLDARASIRAGRARGEDAAQARAVEWRAALSPGKASVHVAAAGQIVGLRAVIIGGSANGVDTVQDENNFLFCMAA